jgi:hypothetical protein
MALMLTLKGRMYEKPLAIPEQLDMDLVVGIATVASCPVACQGAASLPYA